MSIEEEEGGVLRDIEGEGGGLGHCLVDVGLCPGADDDPEPDPHGGLMIVDEAFFCVVRPMRE